MLVGIYTDARALHMVVSALDSRLSTPIRYSYEYRTALLVCYEYISPLVAGPGAVRRARQVRRLLADPKQGSVRVRVEDSYSIILARTSITRNDTLQLFQTLYEYKSSTGTVRGTVRLPPGTVSICYTY